MHTADRQEIVTSFAVAMTVLDLLLAPHRSGARLDEILDELLQHDTAREAQAVRRRYLRTLKALGWHLQSTEPLGKIQVSRHQKQALYMLHFSRAELQWGAAVEVLAPTDLRAQVAQQAQRAAAQYADL